MKKVTLLISCILLLFISACANRDEKIKAKPVWTWKEHKPTTALAQLPTKAVQEKVYEKMEPKVYSVRMRAVGDIMVHKWQLWAAQDQANNAYNFDEQFALVKPILQEADLTIGNLETTFGGAEIGYSGYPRFNTPDSLGNTLKEAGFDILITSNNHSMDTNSKGVIRTLDVLDKIGIEHIGTYRSQYEREQVKIKEVNHISFAFLSYTYGTNGIPIPKEQPYLVNLIDLEKMKEDIKKADLLSPDFIVISLHFGEEYQKYPNDNQKELVDLLFQAGADIILGGHPHVIQPMEVRKIIRSDGTEETGFVIYSLGNFISSQRTPLNPPRDAGVILNLDFEKVENQKAKIKTISIMPTWVQFRNNNGKRVIRAIGSNLSEKTQEELAQYEIQRLNTTREYTLSHLFEEGDMKKEDEFYIYPIQ